MTAPMPGSDLADLINQRVEGAAASWNETDVWVKPDAWHEIAQYLRDDPSLDFTYLNSVTGVDYVEYFEMVYHLTSLRSNRSAVIKLDVYDRESPAVPSVTSIWRGGRSAGARGLGPGGHTFPGAL